MVDAQLQILVRAQNEASQTLKEIRQDIRSVAEDTKSSSETLKEGFSKVQGSVLVLQSVTSSVIGIFQQFERINLRVEAAALRVEGAIDRLKGIQEKHNKLIKDARRDTLNIEKAELSLKKAREEEAKIQETLNDMKERGVNLDEKSPRFIELSRALEEAKIAVAEAEFDVADAREVAAGRAQELASIEEDKKRATDALALSEKKLAQAQQNVILGYIGIGFNMATTALMIPGAISAIGTLGGTFTGAAVGGSSLAAVMSAIYLPLLILIAAVTVAIIIIKNWSTILENLKDLWFLIQIRLEDFGNFLKTTFFFILDSVIEKLSAMWRWIKDTINAIKAFGKRKLQQFGIFLEEVPRVTGTTALEAGAEAGAAGLRITEADRRLMEETRKMREEFIQEVPKIKLPAGTRLQEITGGGIFSREREVTMRDIPQRFLPPISVGPHEAATFWEKGAEEMFAEVQKVIEQIERERGAARTPEEFAEYVQRARDILEQKYGPIPGVTGGVTINIGTVNEMDEKKLSEFLYERMRQTMPA